MAKPINNQLLGGEFNKTYFFKNAHKFLKIGFWYFNGETKHLFFNKKIYAAMGIEPTETGISLDLFFNVIHTDDRKTIAKVIRQLMNKRKSVSSFEVRYKHSSEWRWVRSSAVLVDVDIDKNVKLIVGRISDVDVSKYKKISNSIDGYTNFATFTFDTEIKAITWNSSAYKVLELPERDEPFSFSSIKTIVKPEVVADFEAKWNNFCLKNDKNFVFDLNFVNDKGQTKYFAIYANRVRGKKSTEIQGLLQDRLNIPNELREFDQTKAFFQNTMNQISFPMIVHTGTEVNMVNRFFTKLFGYQSEELIAENGFRQIFMSDEDKIKFKEFIRLRGKQLALPIKSKTGEIRVINWSIFPTNVDNEIIAFGVDITKQHSNQVLVHLLSERNNLYESKLRSFASCTSKDEFMQLYAQTFISLFPKCIGITYILDTNDNFTTINNIIGLSTKRLADLIDVIGWNPIGRRFHISNEQLPKLCCNGTQKVNSGLMALSSSVLLVTTIKAIEKNLNVNDMYLSTYNINDRYYGGLILFKSNETADIKADLLSDLNNLASIKMCLLVDECSDLIGKPEPKLQSSKNIDINNFVNEIITPSNSIIGFTQLLKNQCYNDELQLQYLNSIKSAGQRLLLYANNVCDLARTDDPNFSLSKSLVSIRKVLSNVVLAVRGRMDANKLEHVEIIQPCYADNEDDCFVSDEGRVEQVLELLVDSILRYTDRGVITLNYKMLDNEVQVFVVNESVDIDPNTKNMIVDHFKDFESDNANIGLRLAKRLITLLNGTIEVVPDTTSKISFELCLPKQYLMHKADNEHDIRTDDTYCNLKNKVILIAEDEEFNYKLLQIMLETWGAKIVWAKNGREAVDLVNNMKSHIDLIFMDMRMPDMDGYAATMEIKQINANIPIIAQTAYYASEDRIKAKSAGCDDYIAKPIEKNTLLNLLELYC